MNWVCATAEAVVSRYGLVRAKELAAAGISHSWLQLLVKMRVLTRFPPGVYGRPLNHSPAVCAVVKWPDLVVNGLSALALHGLCPEPRVVSLALDAHAHTPRSTELPIAWSWCQGLADDPDVLVVQSFGLRIRAFSPTRALFECLKKLEAQPLGLVHHAVHEALRLGVFDVRDFRQRCGNGRVGEDAMAALKLLVSNRNPIPVPRDAPREPDRRFVARDAADPPNDDPPPF